MKYGIELRGLDKVIKTTERIEGGDAVLAQALYAEATIVLNESKKIVPVATGNLRASGRVEPPVTGKARRLLRSPTVVLLRRTLCSFTRSLRVPVAGGVRECRTPRESLSSFWRSR